MTQLSDLDKMPFGKFKGTIMQEIPPSYLHYLWQNGMKHETKTSQVANYIERSLSALKLELPDAIWS